MTPVAGLEESHPDSYMNTAVRLARENVGWFDVNQVRRRAARSRV